MSNIKTDEQFEAHWREKITGDVQYVLDQGDLYRLIRSLALSFYYAGRIDVRTEFLQNVNKIRVGLNPDGGDDSASSQDTTSKTSRGEGKGSI